MRALPDVPVFSRADVRSLGWSDAAFTRAVRSGRVIRLRRDQFTLGSPDPRTAAIAASRGCRGSVISDRSATLVHRLPLIGPQPLVPAVSVPPTGTGDLQDAHLYRATLRAVDVVEIDGCLVTSVARTIIDLGRHRPMAIMVVAADAALHTGMTNLDELYEVLEFCRDWPGAARAERALRHVDGRAESPLESVSRLVFAWQGLPAPQTQQRIRNERGVIVARTDFYWDEYGVAGEADGKVKWQDDDAIDDAWERHDELGELGLVVVRWGWDEAFRRPRQLGAKVRRGFDRGLERAARGVPRRWSLAPAPTGS